jgi:hypothetical protein
MTKTTPLTMKLKVAVDFILFAGTQPAKNARRAIQSLIPRGNELAFVTLEKLSSTAAEVPRVRESGVTRPEKPSKSGILMLDAAHHMTVKLRTLIRAEPAETRLEPTDCPFFRARALLPSRRGFLDRGARLLCLPVKSKTY